MALNFNVDPYYDDFDPNKNFHRILYKPGFAVQARELTQSQTILQNQISKFADHIFQKNTPVSGAKLTYNTNCFYVKLLPTINNSSLDVTLFDGALVQNAGGDVIARVLAVAGASGGDPDTIVVSYLSGQQFGDNDIIYKVDNINIQAQAITSGATGPSSVASISEGVFYVVNGFSLSQVTGTKYSIGHFVNVQPQTTILSKYNSTPNVRVGLNIVETIYDYVNDSSLLDPASDSPNFAAPGADRFVINLELETRPIRLGEDQSFIELMRIEGGQIKKQVDGTVYSTIDDYFAKRTFDTNGDYIVTDFKLTPTANSANASLYDLSVGKGVAYVRGYRLENQSDLLLTSERSREKQTINNDYTFINYGNFLYTTAANGFFDYTTFPSVDLHVVGSGSIVTTNANTYGASVAATARVRQIEIQQQSGLKNTYIYRTYLTDIENKSLATTAGASSNSTSVYFSDTNTARFSTVNDAYKGVRISVTTDGVTEFRTLTKYYGSTKYADLDTALSVAPTTSSVLTLLFDVKDVESITNMNKTSTPYKFVANSEISVLSKVSNLSTGDTSISESVPPELVYPIGYPYVSTISDASYSTQYVFKNQNFGVSSATLTLNSGDPFVFQSSSASDYIIINNATGALGSVANVTNISLSGDQKTATLTLATPSDVSSINATVITKVGVSAANNAQYVLKRKNLVEGDTAQVHITGTTVATNTKVDTTYGHVYILNAGVVSPGQVQSLYISDVKRIVKIIDTGNPATAATDGMLTDASYDVTSNYSFDNGQRDSYYGHASIKLKAGRPNAQGNLLVVLDYYDYDTSSGDGYFSVASYLSVSDGGISSSPEQYEQIPTYRAKNGTVYNLRDCLDFRPTVQNAQANFTLITHNAAVFIPTNKDGFISDYSYYLGRRDLLVLSKDKNFEIIKGTPSVNPLIPTAPDGSLVVANLRHDPYTAYVPGEAPRGVLPNLSIEKILHKRWTMSDISDLQTRVNNIEYYTALNALEKNAQSLQIPDANGLNRFKNGILVDDFSSYATSDTQNVDFFANINRREKVMTAPQQVDSFILQNQFLLRTANRLNTANLNFQVKTIGPTNYFMLPYTTANLASQVLASNTININPFAVSQFEGVLDMNPPMDNWVDNTKQPDLLIVDPDLEIYQSSNTLNTLSVGDWQVIPGTSTTNTSSVRQGRTTTTTTSTFASLSQAVTLGYYDKLGSSYYQQNGFITDISVLPFIRPQEILIRARGMLINAPVKAWFDGVNVDRFMSAPDLIELNGVTGTFSEDDVIGYVDNSVFYPIGTVASVYKYPNQNKVRLYIFGNTDSSLRDVVRVENSTFNSDGTRTGNTAFGTPVTSNTVISVHRTGQVSSVGNNLTDKAGNPWKFFSLNTKKFGNFNTKYSIWSSANGSGLHLTPPDGQIPANFFFNVPKSNTYYIKVGGRFSSSEVSSFQVLNSSNGVISFTNDGNNCRVASISLTAGQSNISFRLTSTNTNKENFFALAISDQPWNTGNDGDVRTGANVIFSTTSLVSNAAVDGVNTVTALPNGGVFHGGVTRLSLNGLANTSNSYYNNMKISVTATNVVFDTAKQQYVAQPRTSTANIVSYVGSNNTVFLDSPVAVSTGFNLFAGDITSQYSITGVANSTLLAAQTSSVPRLSTDESGNFTAVFNVPANTFKNGERVFRVDNRLIDTDPTSASTYAEGTFTASGLATKSQAINFSPSISAAKNTFTRVNQRSNVLVNQQVTVRMRRDPVCQSFLIEKDNFPNGAFIDSIKLFFATKPTNVAAPVTISIVGTTNGYPDGSTLDNSIVTLTADRINVSAAPHHLDPSSYTEFVFPAPVYIQPNVLYAVLIQSPSNDYNLYLAAQNAIALPSTVKNLPSDPLPSEITKIGSAPYVGALFESQNNITWTAEQGKALMFVMERCVFDITKQPQLPFVTSNGLPQRKLTNQQIRTFYDANNISNLSGTTVFADINSHAYNITTTDFVPSSTGINYKYRSVLASDRSYTSDFDVTPGKFGCPTYSHIYLNDEKGERVLVPTSNDSFKLTATLSSSDDTVSPVIADDGTTLFNIQYQINDMGLSNDSITLVSGGTGYNTSPVSVVVSQPDALDGVQAVANVTVGTAGAITDIYIVDPGSGYYTTPTITITDSTRGGNSNVAFVVHGETNSSGGNGIARYVTKVVTLTPQNDSGDLRVFYTAYRPFGSNILVYCKILNRNDTQAIEDTNWKLMTTVGNPDTYSRTRGDLYEFEAAPGIDNVANNYVSYTSSNGQTYTSFAQFAIKVVLTTDDKTKVPYLTDLRALALPSGTGV